MRAHSPIRFILLLGLALATPLAFAAAGSVKIISPADGAKLDAMAQNQIVYDVQPGPGGDHTHLYVDGNETAILRKLKGSYSLEGLGTGPHEICIKVVNKGHTPTGVQNCIKVTAQ